MVRTNKSAKASERHSWRGRSGMDTQGDVAAAKPTVAPARARTVLVAVNTRFAARAGKVAPILKDTSIAADIPASGRDHLSVRAENVLKELAADLTGDTPPKGRWIPSDGLLRKLTFKHLKTARNCGPRTIDEIVAWAGLRGVIITKPFYTGKSLAAMWRDLIARCASGQFTRGEIADALERSMRRKNTQIPVALQAILLQILNSAG